MKAMMVLHMNHAVADMKDESREAERCFDKEFGYADEDPIERHVKLYLTPPKAQLASSLKAAQERQHRLEVEEVLIEPKMEVEEVDNPAPFRPGLIQFHRTHSSSRRSLPSFGGSAESGDGMDSNLSTPFGNASDTPGSAWSEESFEAIKPEDRITLYGTADHPSAAFASLHVTGPSRASHISTYSSCSATSTATDSTCRPIRPGLARPRSRAGPYARDDKDGKLDPTLDSTEAWLSGRTISERMVAQAGLSCQRGRANR
jgi:hypothetical protein